MENIITIRNLNCSYDGSRVVLNIKHLDIPRGKIIFFVGPSGIGKSTILETLGFMNNTMLPSSDTKFDFDSDGSPIDMLRCWQWSDDRQAQFRNHYYSFIFQQTNLMPNFSCYENVMSTGLIQGMSQREARSRATNIIEQMNLPTDDRPISAYSGGQQQRIAFARAILPNFRILFADEPTGNLDHHQAQNLMQTLTEQLRGKGNSTSAVIVSHDMNLAVTFADIIVQIAKCNTDDGYTMGVIGQESIYTKNGVGEWTDSTGYVYKMTDCMVNELETKLNDEML